MMMKILTMTILNPPWLEIIGIFGRGDVPSLGGGIPLGTTTFGFVFFLYRALEIQSWLPSQEEGGRQGRSEWNVEKPRLVNGIPSCVQLFGIVVFGKGNIQDVSVMSRVTVAHC